MKATVVVNSMPDILFLWGDEAFHKHMYKVALEAGYIDDSQEEGSELDLSAISQIFSPMIASLTYMNELGNSYQSVMCKDDTLFVFRQFDNLTFFAISKSGKESEEFLKRKLSVVHKLAMMYYGASLDMLKPEVASARKRVWKAIGSLIDTWEELCCQQQSFLVEAVERINVNQALSEMAISLLDSTLSLARNKGDQNTMHALLLVNAKLLALYSSRNASELQAADILMITLFAQNIFPHSSYVVPYSSNRTPPPLAYRVVSKGSPSSIDQLIMDPPKVDVPRTPATNNPRRPISQPISINKDNTADVDSQASSAEDMFYSPPSTPSSNGEWSSPTLDEATRNIGITSDQFFSPRANTPDTTSKESTMTSKDNASDSSSQDDATPKDGTPKDSTPEPRRQEYYHQPVFLHTSRCPYMPHVLHFVQIAAGTVLVLVSEVKHNTLALPIYQTLSILVQLEASSAATGQRGVPQAQATMDRLESYIKKIADILKVSLGAAVDHRVRRLRDSWNMVKRGDLQRYLATTIRELPPNLEAGVGEMVRNLKALFSVLYCTGRDRDSSVTDRHLRAICSIQENLKTRLSDYDDYLQVKGQRNVTMTAYLEDFPGLVHFIYVDRSGDQVTAPSINTTPDKVHMSRDPCYVLKQKIWDMWTYIHTFLLQGHTFVAVRDGDFLFTYCLWFEDSSGNPAPIQGSFPVLQDISPPGILSGDRMFYKIGRRLTHCVVMLTGGLTCLLVLAVPREYSILVTTIAMIGKFCDTAAFSTMYLYTSELYPTVIRNIAMGTASMCARAGGIIAPYIVMLAQLPHISLTLPVVIFGVLSLAAGILSLWLPETLHASMLQTIKETEATSEDYGIPCLKTKYYTKDDEGQDVSGG